MRPLGESGSRRAAGAPVYDARVIAAPDAFARLPGVRRLRPDRQDQVIEVARFLVVGGINWVVDLTVFNLVRALSGGRWILLAKICAVAVATLFSWVLNRHWTFAARATNAPGRELGGFVVVNVLGMLPPLACLGVSHYLLGLVSPLADNISANVVGLVLGTVLRYIGYRSFVFTGSPAPGRPRR